MTDSDSDFNVPPGTTGPLVSALKQSGTAGPGLVRLSGLDHEFRPVAQNDDNTPTIAPSAASAVRDWAAEFAR